MLLVELLTAGRIFLTVKISLLKRSAFRGLTLHVLFANPNSFLRVQHVCAKSLGKWGSESATEAKRGASSARRGHREMDTHTLAKIRYGIRGAPLRSQASAR